MCDTTSAGVDVKTFMRWQGIHSSWHSIPKQKSVMSSKQRMKWLRTTKKPDNPIVTGYMPQILNPDGSVNKLCPVCSFENYIGHLNEKCVFLWQMPNPKAYEKRNPVWYKNKGNWEKYIWILHEWHIYTDKNKPEVHQPLLEGNWHYKPDRKKFHRIPNNVCVRPQINPEFISVSACQIQWKNDDRHVPCL